MLHLNAWGSAVNEGSFREDHRRRNLLLRGAALGAAKVRSGSNFPVPGRGREGLQCARKRTRGLIIIKFKTIKDTDFFTGFSESGVQIFVLLSALLTAVLPVISLLYAAVRQKLVITLLPEQPSADRQFYGFWEA
jgi:hypothetical protein